MMRVVEQRDQKNEIDPTSGVSLETSLVAAHEAFSDLAVSDIQTPDLVDQLNGNIDRLIDLQARMQFMIREVRTLMRV